MKKKKILLIYYVLFNPGGVARVMTNLANELVEQGNEVEILLLTSKTDAFYSLNKNIAKTIKLPILLSSVTLNVGLNAAPR